MFVITDAHMQALSVLNRSLIVEKTLAVLVQRDGRLAQEAVRQAAETLLRQAVNRSIDVLGCSNESCAADYAGLVYTFGFGFEHDVKVASILARTELSIEARLQLVFRELSDEDWSRLQAACST